MIEEVYSKILLRRLSPKLTLKFTARNSNLKSAKFNLSNVNIGAWLNISTLFYQFISEMNLFYFNKWARRLIESFQVISIFILLFKVLKFAINDMDGDFFSKVAASGC